MSGIVPCAHISYQNPHSFSQSFFPDSLSLSLHSSFPFSLPPVLPTSVSTFLSSLFFVFGSLLFVLRRIRTSNVYMGLRVEFTRCRFSYTSFLVDTPLTHGSRILPSLLKPLISVKDGKTLLVKLYLSYTGREVTPDPLLSKVTSVLGQRRSRGDVLRYLQEKTGVSRSLRPFNQNLGRTLLKVRGF